MTDIFDLLTVEEGWRDKPYIDSEGYPSVGFGFLIGPKGAQLANYRFTLPRTAGEVWMRCILDDMVLKIETQPAYAKIRQALNKLRSFAPSGTSDYGDPRICVLLSMCYQMGLDGVAKFENTLGFMANGNFTKAAVNMLASLWAKQTPNRANRHAEQMRSGKWYAY